MGANTMNQFQKMAKNPPKCNSCGAEIVFPTSTMPPDAPDVPDAIKCPCCGNAENVGQAATDFGEIYSCGFCFCAWDEKKRSES